MTPKFQNFEEGFGSELLCPTCSSNYLHHDRVEIFERDEDASHGVHVVVDDGKATLDTLLVGNPSIRRHGLNVHFWCENCKTKTVLSIGQHKGNTYVNFK